MKTIETKLYSFTELSPEARARVIAREAENAELDCSDMTASLEAVCDACDLRLVDYSFGTYDRNHKVRVSGNAEGLEGRRALAWFLRVLIRHGYARPARFVEMQFPGVCGLTGVCYDDTIVETVWKALLEGDNVRHAFDAVSYTLCRECEAEIDYLQSEEWIMETLDQSAEIYTEEGTEF
jgi:hypothetical protein